MLELPPPAAAVAVRPPYGPTGTGPPESASKPVTRPLPVCVPLARTVTPGGGVRAVVVASLCIQ